jgi:GGDEF domain-containing protein
MRRTACTRAQPLCSLRIIVFIDLDAIHRLDQEVGYAEVDRRVRATFSASFRRSDILARWYSGDEIVILFDGARSGAERKMTELTEVAAAEGLTLKYDLGEWDVGKEPVEDIIEGLSAKVILKKSNDDDR